MKSMSEKTYKKIQRTGASNIALGTIAVVLGITIGTLTIVSGAKLLATKKELIELM
jgi:hypothetical protein